MDIKFEDGSGDKEFFTIIPNYVLNHSTQCDRDVYIQIKRVAGETGECYMSQTKLANQCGISINRLKKSLQYLLEHKWIIDAGKKPVPSKGGEQHTNVYRVANLWELNMKHYRDKLNAKGVSHNDTPNTKGVSRTEPKGYHENDKGVSPSDDKEYPLNNIHIKEEHISNSKELLKTDPVLKKEIDFCITCWKAINPNYKSWFNNKTERKAIKTMLTDEGFGKDKFLWVLQNLKSLAEGQYCPNITTPYKLLNNWSAVVLYIKKEFLKKTKEAEDKTKDLKFEKAQLALTRERTPQQEQRLQELNKLLK